MNRNTKLVIIGLIASVAIAGLLRKVSSVKKLGNLLSVTPKLKGMPQIVGGVIFGKLVVPVVVQFANRTAEVLNLRIQSVKILYKGILLGDIVPNASILQITGYSVTEYPVINFEIPIATLLSSGIGRDLIMSDNGPRDVVAQMSLDITAEVNGISTSFNQTLSGNQPFAGLGLVAQSQRKILPKSHYAHLIDPIGQLERTDPILLQDGYVPETLDYMISIVRTHHTDTAKLAQTLKGKDLRDTLERIFKFVYRYIRYEMDNSQVEQLRRPLRTLHDQKGDCDCYSILIGSILHNLNIPFTFRVTAYSDPNRFQHVYVIVPKPGGGHYTVDPVLDRFNEEKKFSNHKDYKYTKS